jgi:hypothetical protein
MFGGAIDVPLPITTFSNGAMVDVIAAVGVVTRREGV